MLHHIRFKRNMDMTVQVILTAEVVLETRNRVVA